MLAHGGTLEYFVGAVFNYPTFAEACKIAALDAWNRVRAQERLKALLRPATIPYHGGPFRLPGIAQCAC